MKRLEQLINNGYEVIEDKTAHGMRTVTLTKTVGEIKSAFGTCVADGEKLTTVELTIYEDGTYEESRY